MNDISMALNQLYRVTLLIQRSGKKYRFRRADNQLPRLAGDEDFVELRGHLKFMILLGHRKIHTEFWKQEDYEKLSEEVTGASDLKKVHKILIDANIMRRNRIRHATRHLVRQKTSTPAPESAPKPPTPQGSLHTATETTGTEPNQLGESEPPAMEGHGLGVQNQVSAQIPDQHEVTPEIPQPAKPPTSTEIGTMFMKGPRTVRGKGTAITRITRIGAKQDYPKCPKGRGMFSCPYCAQTLSADYTNISRWRYALSRPQTATVPELTPPKEDMSGRI
jgi:hypothetical protein